MSKVAQIVSKMAGKNAARMETVSTILFNPAPLIKKDEQDGAAATGVGEPFRDREATPWYLSIPSLGVATMVLDANGKPVTGYFEMSKAQQYVAALLLALRNPDVLKEYQENREWPDQQVQEGYKMMPLTVMVPAA